MKRSLATCSVVVAVSMLGCSPDKPSQQDVVAFVSNQFRSQSTPGTFGTVTKTYSNVQLLNQWADENAKGVYYVKVSFDYEDNWFASSCIQTWRLVKQGKLWEPDKSPVQNDCKDRGGRGLFQR